MTLLVSVMAALWIHAVLPILEPVGSGGFGLHQISIPGGILVLLVTLATFVASFRRSKGRAPLILAAAAAWLVLAHAVWRLSDS
jgi:hypothetical protein